jgi:putative endonuclease
MSIFYAYILRSETHGTCYYGNTQNINARIRAHNSGKVRYTKGRRPWKLVYYEKFETRSEAVKRERFFKSIDGYRYLKSNGII